MARKVSRVQVFEAVAKSLREFGYPDVKVAMIADTYEAMKRNERPLPHGVVGMFVERQLEEFGVDKIERLI